MVTRSQQGMLEGHHVVVTGGAQGIGEAIVEDALTRGARVSFFDISQEQAQILLQRLEGLGFRSGQDVDFQTCDVTNFSAIESAVAACT